MTHYENNKMHDVLDFWESFKVDYGKRSHSPSGEPGVPNMVESHIQGFGRVYDEKLKKYLCVASHNNKGYSKGFMMYLNCGKSGEAIKQDVPIEHYNHPGGLQVVGNYMFIAVENSGYNSSFVRLCDLSNLFSSGKPDWIDTEKFVISMPDHGAGMVGATRYTDADGKEQMLITPCDNGILYIYKVEAGNDLPVAASAKPVLLNKQRICDDVQNLCLVTQEDNTVFLVAFCSSKSGTSFKDTLELWKCNMDSGKPLFSRVGDPFHVKTSGGGAAGVHFRYGAGMRICGDNTMEFYATQRNFVGGSMTYDILGL